MHPDDILQTLLAAGPRPTFDCPRDARGIYLLHDHEGRPAYIGCTKVTTETFHSRIHHRHRSGSEDMSHQFSRAYNVGRLWRDRHAQKGSADAGLAKRVRRTLIARHCGASWVALDLPPQEIVRLEGMVLRAAPPSCLRWNDGHPTDISEPVELVDALIDEMGLDEEDRAALERQAMRSQDRTLH